MALLVSRSVEAHARMYHDQCTIICLNANSPKQPTRTLSVYLLVAVLILVYALISTYFDLFFGLQSSLL